jgi:hypothetical protein
MTSDCQPDGLLEGRSGITRNVIDSELTALNVTTSYEYSFYDGGGGYFAHTMNWREYSSYTYDWVYYVDVDIWTDGSGNLRRSMCSYYSG